MGITIRGKSDADLKSIARALEPYAAKHPKAEITLRRRDAVIVHVRIIDPAFARVSRATRHDRIWKYLETLDLDVLNQVTILLPLTPKEAEESFTSREFDKAPRRLRL